MGSWDTRETSGLLDNADVYIEKARFGYDAEYGDKPIFILEGRSPEANPEDGNTVRQFYSIGSGWEPAKGGKAAENTEGHEDFHASSAYAKFFAAALQLGEEVAELIKGRGFPDDATIWEGLAFHMERIEQDYGKDIGKKRLLLPVAFLGEVEFPGAGGKKASGGNAAAKAKAAKAKAAKKGSGDGLEAALTTLAQANADSHDNFLAAVYEQYPDIEESDLFASVIDEDGLWAEANA